MSFWFFIILCTALPFTYYSLRLPIWDLQTCRGSEGLNELGSWIT